ncbi:PncB Nicotinic acid phosphoribosyltransferase [uncultured Caudovirales phage]|uniref:Nicotinamide phosphoribosyltransferase n=1 Tax=uncultured Caudovirales phage TaxID=2100421 RepID=A0A6J5RRH9_9CAUD|nr:PncB Nicotinic acid phosphoribosyltransferase [uncultured Caudovirales phage]
MKINVDNLILKSDSYKFSQWKQYPENSSNLFSYFESRGGVYKDTLFFGLQYYIKKFLSKPITLNDVKEASEFMKIHGVDFNYEGWEYIVKEHGGKLPVRIRAVPEGTVVPVGNCLMTIESTDPKVFWIVNWLETLLVKIWYATTVATQSYYLRKVIYDSLVKSSDDPDSEIDFKLHSFGYRGVSSEESAGIGGAAELLSFKGTDTIYGILIANEYYDSGICGFSINASEHSTITSFGKDGEVDAYKNMIKQFAKPGAIFACVSDSYDIYNAITNLWGTALKNDIINSGAILVIRPDSGNPLEVVPKCLYLMEEKFGSTLNSKGYKVLNNVRLIQGDGVNPTSIKQILNIINFNGFSTTNIAFGMGGASLQGSSANTINRDTQKFAFKASSITVNGESRDVFKSPITDSGKKSKCGRLDLVKWSNGEFQTVILQDNVNSNEFSVMQTVYENGELIKEENFNQIKNRICK